MAVTDGRDGCAAGRIEIALAIGVHEPDTLAAGDGRVVMVEGTIDETGHRQLPARRAISRYERDYCGSTLVLRRGSLRYGRRQLWWSALNVPSIGRKVNVTRCRPGGTAT